MSSLLSKIEETAKPNFFHSYLYVLNELIQHKRNRYLLIFLLTLSNIQWIEYVKEYMQSQQRPDEWESGAPRHGHHSGVQYPTTVGLPIKKISIIGSLLEGGLHLNVEANNLEERETDCHVKLFRFTENSEILFYIEIESTDRHFSQAFLRMIAYYYHKMEQIWEARKSAVHLFDMLDEHSHDTDPIGSYLLESMDDILKYLLEKEKEDEPWMV